MRDLKILIKRSVDKQLQPSLKVSKYLDLPILINYQFNLLF